MYNFVVASDISLKLLTQTLIVWGVSSVQPDSSCQEASLAAKKSQDKL